MNLDLPGACSPPATGWITTGDALLANTAAALAREYDEAGRDALRQQAWADAHNTHPWPLDTYVSTPRDPVS